MPRHQAIENFRKNVKAWRVAKGLTIPQMADAVQCSRAGIMHIECGRNVCSLERAIMWSEVLDVPLEKLLQDTLITANDIADYQYQQELLRYERHMKEWKENEEEWTSTPDTSTTTTSN